MRPVGPYPPAPNGRPLFLDAAKAESAPYVQEFDSVPNFRDRDIAEPTPTLHRPLIPRHKEVARMYALGKTLRQIAEKLDYEPASVQNLIKTPRIQEEVDRYRNRLYEQDLVSHLKDLGNDSVRIIEEVIRNPAVKMRERTEAAKWVLEKLTGKAKQEVNVESSTLSSFMDLLKNMQSAGEPLERPIDVTPTQEGGSAHDTPQLPVTNRFDDWAKDI